MQKNKKRKTSFVYILIGLAIVLGVAGYLLNGGASRLAALSLEIVVNPEISVTAQKESPSLVIAGSRDTKLGSFVFTANKQNQIIKEMQLIIPEPGAFSMLDVTISYTNSDGAIEKKSQLVAVQKEGGYVLFTGLDLYVPKNQSRNLDVYVQSASIPAGATSGVELSARLDKGLFKAVGIDGVQVKDFLGLGSLDLGGLYIVKSYPEIKGVKKGSDTPSSITPLFEFTIAANNAGTVEWKKLTFAVNAQGVNVSNLYVRQKGYSANVNNSFAQINNRGEVEIFAGTQTNNNVEQIRAGGSKTYQLFAGAVTGWDTGDVLTISISPDWQNITQFNGSELTKIGKFVWSDRSAYGHTLHTNDWFISRLVPQDPAVSGAITYTNSGNTFSAPVQENRNCNSWLPWSRCVIR